jgi:hypothetical protein
METELIVLIGLVILIILYLGYKYFIAKDDLKNTKKDEDTNEPKAIKNNFDNKKKIIQYFGGDYCPFSNFTSNAYKIMKDFENEYGDKITVNYYWAGKDNEIMQALDVKYVPTILNGNNEPIELKLPDDVDTNGLSNGELRTILLENIYNNL